jgi:5-methylcytosine-specific restriction endonuclease McrA
MEGDPPRSLPSLDVRARTFPSSWKDAAVRRLFDEAIGGIRCPLCRSVLSGRRHLAALQADHIVPWSKGGLSTWANLQLLCRPCNIRKSDRHED